MDQKLTIGFFLLGCVIVVASVLAFIRIERLEDIIIRQQETIELQSKAIELKTYENTLLKSIR